MDEDERVSVVIRNAEITLGPLGDRDTETLQHLTASLMLEMLKELQEQRDLITFGLDRLGLFNDNECDDKGGTWTI